MKSEHVSGDLARSSLILGFVIGLAVILPAPLYAQDVLNVINDRVGIGTSAPSVMLEVESSTGIAKIMVDENAGSVAKRELFVLENVGAPQFKFIDINAGREWQFALLTNSDFVISLVGTGGSEFQVYKTGRVTMGPGPAINFDLEADGDLIIAGTLTQGSSREIKTGIFNLDTTAVLEKVANLSVNSWAYRSDPSTQHAGPMAEDFHAAFGFGSDAEHLAPGDVAGVSLAAIKGLIEENQGLKQRLEVLEATVQQLME